MNDPIVIHERSALVTGAGGFVGGHLAGELVRRGYGSVRAVDIKPLDQWHQLHEGVESIQADLSLLEASTEACQGIDDVFNLAANMGGMGFIETHRAACMLNVLINTHMLIACQRARVSRYFFSSSACVYNVGAQSNTNSVGLREQDAYPAMPEDGYGWEKLFSERMCESFQAEYGIETRVARFHNIYGPHGAFDGGREKAPAAICRKVANVELHGCTGVDVWGDGRQTRSFTYIDDCVDGILRLFESDCHEPLNIGSDEQVSINDLVSIVEDIAGVKSQRTYLLDAPTGVRGRNSDNHRVKELLAWAPTTPLRDGLAMTYQWVRSRVAELGHGGGAGAHLPATPGEIHR